MSTKGGRGEKTSSSKKGGQQRQQQQLDVRPPPPTANPPTITRPPPSNPGELKTPQDETTQTGTLGSSGQTVTSTAQTGTAAEQQGDKPRQVIAVSASKGPAAFFNLARKFLVTDEMCDLSALEGAIVAAVDAAHLLERSKLATIVRVQTSYVTVEPKRKKSQPQPDTTLPGSEKQTQPGFVASISSAETARPESGGVAVGGKEGQTKGKGSSGRELRRARIVITVRRTEGYKQWLEENPLQAIIAGDGDEDVEGGGTGDTLPPSS
eukprot:CAMPEP_0116828274 /NCGR_PEP_ID=MMETSP0418-20121206/3567_1 /TAXON_ID=1158023 /ORGANISM="Astrosyne radiata, Strain 13vi08-1A" /LENGTH=265 /DNA_ID=CAMNT_0004457149 /DNA_START=35 /DNA_END=832 /DNA_ORIENTATION=+